MSDEKTIAALKTNFLRQQIRILSQPLKLSNKVKERAELSEDDLRDIMLKANQILRRHNNGVYDRVAVSNVATQIEQLFWYASGPDDLIEGEQSEYEGILRVGDDLADADNIQKLSTMFDEEDQSEEFRDELSKLQDLNERRQALQRKLERYKELQKMLEPLKNPQENVQPSLVTRDGPLADELAKTKTLGIRVARNIARRNERGGKGGESEDEDIVMVDEAQKVAAILGKR